MKPYQDPFARATGWLTTAADQVAAIKTMNKCERNPPPLGVG